MSTVEHEIRCIVRDELRIELARIQRANATPALVPHTAWGLGTRRQCAKLARSGLIQGARRVGKLWMCTPGALVEYISKHGAPSLVAPTEPADEIDAIVARARRRRRA